jgi:hypothetical protein
MSAYFIPLTTLIPSVVGLPIEDIPILGAFYENFGPHIGVRDLHETWNDTHSTISAEAVIDTEIELEFGSFALIAGRADGEQTTFRFEMSSSRASLLDFLGPDAASADPALVAFLHTDAFPKNIRITIHDLGFKLRLPRDHAKLGERIMDGSTVVGVRAMTPAQPVDIVLPQATLVLDTVKGISITLDDDLELDCPPFLLGDSGIGFEIRDLKVDLSTESGIPEVISRPGFDETWRGVYVGELDIYNLNSLLPFLPRKIAATRWIIGNEGWSGAVDFTFPPPDPTDVWRPGQLGIEFDRGSLVRGTISAIFQVRKVGPDLATLGPGGDLEILFTLRHNPAVSGAAAWGFEIGLLTPGDKDGGLFTLSEEFLDITESVIPVIVLTSLAMEDEISAGDGLVYFLLTILEALQLSNSIVIKRFTLDALRFRYYTRQIDADAVRLVDFVFDVQLRLAIDIDLGFILRMKTDRPIGVAATGLTLTWVPHWDSLPDSTHTELGGRFQFRWEQQGGLSFDLSEQSLVRNSALEFFKFGVGQWEKGLWFDIGVRSTANLSETVMGGGAVRIFYLADGTRDHFELQGLAVTVLVPEVLYCKTELGWGDVNSVSTRAMLVGNGTASLSPFDPADPLGKLKRYMKRSAWLWDAEVLMRLETLPSGAESIVIGVDINFSSGIPLGSSGISLFGLLGQYAQNARPNVVGDDYLAWFHEVPSVNTVIGPNKWIAEEGSWGFGIGTVLGPTCDLGRTWNAKVGLTVLIPGPVIILFGAANVLKGKPGLKSSEAGAFVALIVLDFEQNTFTLSIVVDYSVPDSGSVFKIKIPAEIFVDLEEASNTHLYLGEHLPLSRRVTAQSLGLFDMTGYLMLDGRTITNLAGKGFDIPAFAIAFGGRAEFSKGLKSGRLRCYFSLGVEIHTGLGLPDPVLVFGKFRLDGGLVVKVFGFGFDFTIWAELTAIAPTPFFVKGTIGITIDQPWPIPNIHASLPLNLIDGDGDVPPPGSVESGLTLIPRNENQPTPLSQSALTENVPVDATFSLSFRFPMRNTAGTVGSFNCNSTNFSTKYITGAGHGYAFELVDLHLVNLTTGTDSTNLPAIWRPELNGVKAHGGEEARMVLELMSYDAIITSRFVGASATYVDGATANWDPCQPPDRDPKKVCYGFNGQTPGVVGNKTLKLKQPSHPDVSVFNLPPPENAEELMTTFGYRLRRSEVVTIPLVPPTGVVALPLSEGLTTPSPFVCETLVLEFERALDVTISCVRNSARFPRAQATFFDGAKVIGTSPGATVSFANGFEEVDFNMPGLTTRVEIRSWSPFQRANDGPNSSDGRMFLVRLCMHYEADLIENAENAATIEAWQDFWSDLLAQDAAASDALLLDADSRYRIVGRVNWSHLEDPSSGNQEVFEFDFHTQPKSREIKPLRKRDHQLPINDDRWEIDTLPRDGTFAMYLQRPIRLTFSSPRVEAVFAKFDEKLVLRLIDDKGQDLFDTLEFLREHATELPEYQQVWQQHVLAAACTPDGVSSLWDVGVAIFDMILQRNRDYAASLHVVPITITNFAAAEWKDFRIVHGFKFRTSRWLNSTEHLAAHVLRDEIADVSPDLAEIASDADAVSGTIEDDQLLERVLYDHIGLPVRPPAVVPEVTIVWRNVGDVYSAVGLLLDGPEPLLREAGSSLGLARADSSTIGFLNLTGQSRTRSLLLFSAGGVFVPLSNEAITLTIRDVFMNSSAIATTETASLTVSIPETPSILMEEPAP